MGGSLESQQEVLNNASELATWLSYDAEMEKKMTMEERERENTFKS